MALGYFDGVHLGHQKVIQTAKQIADQYGYKSAVMTFHPHPSVVLGRSQQHVRFITPLKEKEKQIAKLGVDYLYVVEFTPEFAYLLPQQFVDEYIIGLGVKHVVAGFDFTYGRLGKGTMETLPFHSREQFTQTVIPKQTFGEEKISSTYIRQRLAEGDVEQLPHLLGRWYEVTGTVIHGDKRGRTIGFPTANVALDDDYMIPRIGVYAVTVTIDDNTWTGVCNVGYKPTFHAQQQKIRRSKCICLTFHQTFTVHMYVFNGINDCVMNEHFLPLTSSLNKFIVMLKRRVNIFKIPLHFIGKTCILFNVC